MIGALSPSTTAVSSFVVTDTADKVGASETGVTVISSVSEPDDRLGLPTGKPFDTLAVMVGAVPL